MCHQVHIIQFRALRSHVVRVSTMITCPTVSNRQWFLGSCLMIILCSIHYTTSGDKVSKPSTSSALTTWKICRVMILASVTLRMDSRVGFLVRRLSYRIHNG